MSAVTEHANVSSVCAEYESLKAAATSGQQQLQQVSSQFESANNQLKQKQAEVDKLTKTSNELQQQLSKLNQDVATAQRELNALCDQYRLTKQVFQSSVQSWLSQRSELHWLTPSATPQLLPMELLEDLYATDLTNSALSPAASSSMVLPPISFPSFSERGRGSRGNDLKHLEETLSRFISEFRQAHSTAKNAQQQLTQDRLQALQQRSRLMLDSDLAGKLYA